MSSVVATREQAETLVVEMLRDLKARAQDAEELGNGNDFVVQIMANIIAADTFEEIFEAQSPDGPSSKTFIDRPFLLTADGIRWMRSAPAYVAEGAIPHYALLTVQDLETGDYVTLNAGGNSTVTALWKLEKKGYFDQPRGLRFSAIPTQSGREVIILRPVVIPTVPAAKPNGKKN